jgi:hypothetical protein
VRADYLNAVEGQPPPLPPPSPPLPPLPPPPSPPPPVRPASRQVSPGSRRRRRGPRRGRGSGPVSPCVRHTMTPNGPCVLGLYSYSCTAMTSFRALRLRQHDATSPLLDPIPFLGLHRPRTAHPCILHSRRSWSEHCAQMHAEAGEECLQVTSRRRADAQRATVEGIPRYMQARNRASAVRGRVERYHRCRAALLHKRASEGAALDSH